MRAISSLFFDLLIQRRNLTALRFYLANDMPSLRGGRPDEHKSHSKVAHPDFLSSWKDGEPDEYNAATVGGKVESG